MDGLPILLEGLYCRHCWVGWTYCHCEGGQVEGHEILSNGALYCDFIEKTGFEPVGTREPASAVHVANWAKRVLEVKARIAIERA
jgi:hypothetical protein